MNEVPEAICWHEGMQLLPQHFQQQSLRAETLAARHAAAAHPWFWGVQSVDIDESALRAGIVRVQALEAVLPDGLPVGFDAGVRPALELDVTDQIAASTRHAVTVFVAVAPLWRGGRLDPRGSRYLSVHGEAVPDLAGGETPEPLVLWRPDLRLVTDDTRADLVCIPLLRVEQQGGGFAPLPYVPPTPRLQPESPLGRKVAGLCARVREKCVYLAGRVRAAQQAGRDEEVPELSRQLRSLWSRLPEVEAALSSRIAHPAQVHLLLAGMAGAVATLDPAAGVPAFRPLEYGELLAGYDELIGWLDTALGRVKTSYRTVPFARDAAGFWLDLADLPVSAAPTLGVRMPGGEQGAIAWLQQAIIASDGHVATLVRQRMRGLSWQALDQGASLSYSVPGDMHLVVLDTDSEWFDRGARLRLTGAAGATLPAPWEVVLFLPAEDR
ncbi:type VI secretion system baseplate subunit TssK [Jeongeupia sp. USM3]|uniref:type VI secretion system baseplate subunit TssK n=1 Tax=Jeongeupia sp. USM3 TaxID=1906741 RepID=UPI00089DDB5F|nr:type VI secretion system baseplate subunit TssK [Jeongeupia sp. USM3]AOY01846.1 type VI secretion system-associated protein [Jeongeupia sp. USM3]